LAFVIVVRTRTVHGSGMEAASATISPLWLDVDLMEHKVLMRMCGGTRWRVVALARGWPESATGWKRVWGKRSQGCEELWRESDNDERKKRVNGVNPDPRRSIYRGSTGSACCGSFCRTTRYNVSIVINSREDCIGFIVNRLSQDLNSEFRSSAGNKTPWGQPDDKQGWQAPTSH
jgi:hypothetical protein